jgi:antitoxin FitA
LEVIMVSLTLKGIPDDVHSRLKARALRNGRSLSSEALACLRQAVFAERVDVDDLLARASVLRENAAVYLTDRELARIRREDLP